MPLKPEHIPGEDLLLFLDGELQERRKSELKKHLEACWECRARMMNLQNTIADFINLHHRRVDSLVPCGDGPRALLRARLREQIKNDRSARRRWPLLQAGWWTASLASAAALAAIFIFLSLQAGKLPSGVRDEPIPALTPGKSVAVTVAEVCSPAFEKENLTNLPVSLKRQVFDRYGMPHPHFQDFEVDFLITPELGGAPSVQNLWPEPYAHTPWNAHIKDQLEVRLHTLVCDHQMTLSMAQNEISSDWIRAYRKIFRTNRPLVRPQPVALLFTLLKLPVEGPPTIEDR